MLYAPPTGETNYPVLNTAFDKDIVFENMYLEKRNAMIPHRPGKFSPSFRFVNQLVCYNLDPRATENKPSETTGNILMAFLEEETACDWARYIFVKIVEFRDASTNTRMPFPVLISSICRAEEGLASKYFKNDEAHPGDIDSSILQKRPSTIAISCRGDSKELRHFFGGLLKVIVENDMQNGRKITLREADEMAAKDALLRRNIAVDPFCSLCSQDLETIEHLFFNCDFAKIVWRASHLGFDFTVGTALGFVDWFVQWLKHALDKELIQDLIFIMWSIWRDRNDVLFKSTKG
ncbi:hypothetical protein RHGRI_036892 [Rhododendron griersonianum]|uniref:Reverse transcriptase zinc-binding domain-containing protein n=1 Tax=Rhododendron griersonianum TaxID=479676 RepID=A0AAV6HPS6_9ERIC|nr:hypothetical protein RHGRI_036892 [Rhododendron griersonianum]